MNNATIKDTTIPTDRLVNFKFDSLRDWHAYLLISMAGVVLYAKTVMFLFTYCDDTQLIVVNSEFLSHLSNLPKLFTQDVFISIPNPFLYLRPMLNISFMLDAQIGGDAPGFYHFTNIVLHVACSLLVFVLFKKLHSQRLVATCAALIFSVHPLLTYAVAWIPGRNDSLFTLFVLGSFIFMLRLLERRRTIDYVFHFLLLGLALLTKETAVMLTVMVLLYFLIVRKEIADKKLLVRVLVGWTLMIILWLYMRSTVVQSFIVNTTIKDSLSSWISRSPALILYFGKVMFPFNLSVFPNLQDNGLWWGVSALVVFALLVLKAGEKNYRMIVWGMLWFFLFLAPSIIAGDFLPEHRAYCSLVGFLIAFYEIPFLKNLPWQKRNVLVLFSAAIFTFGAIAYSHSENFRDRRSFCINMNEKSPSVDESCSGMAGMLIDQGDYQAAEKVIMKGIARKQNMKVVHRMLGDIYAKKGDQSKAEMEYTASLDIEPLHLLTYVNYGNLCLSEERLDDAERLWKMTVAIDPDFIRGYYLLANFFLRQRDDPTTATYYVHEIERRGVPVMPELISDITSHPKYRVENNGSSKR